MSRPQKHFWTIPYPKIKQLSNLIFKGTHIQKVFNIVQKCDTNHNEVESSHKTNGDDVLSLRDIVPLSHIIHFFAPKNRGFCQLPVPEIAEFG